MQHRGSLVFWEAATQHQQSIPGGTQIASSLHCDSPGAMEVNAEAKPEADTVLAQIPLTPNICLQAIWHWNGYLTTSSSDRGELQIEKGEG